jgi:tRNA U34 5-methylaminomethyl-2-thiouridine-forming methyltransferase MnmC
MASGLQIGSTPPVGRRAPGTVTSWVATDLPLLSWQEQEHLLTRAAIPYRDPHLNDTADAILHRRLREQQNSSLSRPRIEKAHSLKSEKKKVNLRKCLISDSN